MKQRNSNAYLIVSSAHLGVSEDIAKIYARVAEFYDAKVFHLGATMTDKEIKEYSSLKRKKEVLEARMETSESDAEKIRATLTLDVVEEKISGINSAETERIFALTEHFDEVTFVSSPDMSSEDLAKHDRVTVVQYGMELSKYLYLSAVQTTGDRNTTTPISRNARNYLKRFGKFSYIVAHPVPKITTLPKPGLNQAHSYYTVGSLRHVEAPGHFRNFYKVVHMPCAIVVLVDAETGEYHAKQLFIDYLNQGNKPMVLDDGMVFTPTRNFMVDSSDKATLSTDDHAPHQHPGVLGALRGLNELHQPELFINNGDACEFGSVNRHTKDRPGDREGMRFIDDLNSLERLLDAQVNVKSIKRRVLIDSNHHEWVSLFVAENPALKGTIDWPTIAKRPAFAKWEVMIRKEGEPRLFYFGDFLIRHGDQENLMNGSDMNASGKYACGHYHRFNTYLRAIMIGCGRDLGPGFTAGQVNSWISMTTSLTKYHGIAAANPKVVLHDKQRAVSRFAYRNTIYEVDHYKIAA